MKSRHLVFGLSLLLGLGLVVGCKPKVSPMPEKKAEVAPPAPAVVEKPTVVDTSDNASFREAQLAAELERMVRENLLAVYFEYNSSKLTQETVGNLGKAAKFLSDYPNLRILVQGHCDERGSSEYNMALGESRARAVKEYFSTYGIQAHRLEVTSYGKERPATPNCGSDDACHAKNRRAEFQVLAK